jgi:uncharacterized protein (DUF2147 family)
LTTVAENQAGTSRERNGGFRGKLRVVDGGQKLELRGFIGFSLLGRTQTWTREPS